jgi:hypothetical protein
VPILIALALLVVAPILAHAQGAGADSVHLSWTAPGDDSLTGTAALYDVRVSTSPITAGNFDAATVVSGAPAPAVSGTLQSLTVTGLTRGTTYWFAIKTRDEADQWSGISNIVRWDWVFDSAPPAAPSGLVAARTGTDVHLVWTPNAEADLSGYTVYRATNAGGPFSPVSGGIISTADFDDTATPGGATMVWYAVSASDANGNESARSASVQVALVDGSERLAIQTPYPNPSRGADLVRIPVDVPAAGADGALIDIVDSGGRRVRRIDIGGLVPGAQEVAWDGRNDAGREVAPGAYRAWLTAGDVRTSVRMLRLP